MSSSTGSCAQASITYCVPLRLRSEGAWTTSGRAASEGGCGGYCARSSPGGTTCASGTQRSRVVGADDLGVGPLAVGELGGRLAADVRAEVVEDALAPRRAQDRELDRLRHERQPEVEVEDVGLRQQPRERRELGRKPPRQPAAPLERPVGLGVQPAAVEDDEPRVDALAPQRLGRSPTGSRRRSPGSASRAACAPARPVTRGVVRFGHLWIDRHEVGTESVTKTGLTALYASLAPWVGGG